MLTVLAFTLCALPGLGSCADEELTAPRQAQQEVAANTVIVSDTLCARAQFTITSPTAVTTLFSNRTTCTTKLVLIRGQAATWAQNPSRRLILYVRLLNKSGQTLQLPVRLYLPATGITVVAPAGTPASKVVPLLPDSTDASGGKIWFVGGTGTLAANDSTGQDTIKVNVMSPVMQARLQFQASALAGNTSRPPIPNTTIVPDDSTYTVADANNLGLIYYRRYVHVLFLNSATGPQVQTFISKYSGTIVGGIPTLGEYTLRIADPGSSWSQVSALISAMRAEPGVEMVGPARRLGPSGEVDGRYPDDGIQHRRSNWVTPNAQGVWGFQAIRAPLAWGCENGRYTSSYPRVGVLEFTFDPLSPDLSPLAPSQVVATTDPTLPTIPAPTLNSLIWHGTTSSSLLTAVGNDSTGIAGMMWRTNLRVFSLNPTNANQRAQSMRGLASELIPAMATFKPEVVASQLRIGEIADTAQVADLTKALIALFTASPRTIWVQTIGDDMIDMTEGQLKNSGLPRLGLRSALLGAWNAGFSANILFVAATDSANGFSSAPLPTPPSNVGGAGSSFIRQRTEIAAPGAGVEVVAPVGFSTPFALAFGTSVSGPLVAGVVAQLRAMDSTLTAAQVKSYILRGAQQPRLDPSTGSYVAPSPVTGAPETVYQLDAYGALSLLSKERPGTPICGYPVWYGPNEEVALLRNGLNAPEEIGPTGLLSTNVSVAQGGRQIAITAYPLTPPTIGELYYGRLQSGQWQWSLIPGRQYLETWSFLELDTMMQKGTALASTALTLIGPGRPGARGPALSNADLFQLPSVLGPGGQYAGGDVVLLSPDGQWAMIALVKFVGSTLVRGTYLVKLSDFSAIPITEAPDGAPADIIIRTWAWSHDGTKFLGTYEPNGVPDHSAIYRLVDVSANSAVVRVPDVVAAGKRVVPISLSFSIEDAVIYGEEVDLATPSNCTPVQRRVSDLAVTQSLGQFGNSTCIGPAIPQANLIAGRTSIRRDSAGPGHPHSRRRTPTVMPQSGRHRRN
ncbi:MAG: S8 family serine peptidase [Gemmatimonadales bacterium]